MVTSYDFITVGSAVRDITFYTPEGKVFKTPQNLTSQMMLGFEYGAKISIHDVNWTFGGGGTNVAVSLARLGFKVSSMVAVGKDSDGQAIVNNLKSENVRTNFIQQYKEARTGFSFIVANSKKDNEHVAFTYRGANDEFSFAPTKLRAKRTNWLYLTHLADPEHKRNLQSIFETAKKRKMRVAWNPGKTQLALGKNLLTKYLRLTDILVLNKDEAIELVLACMRFGKRTPTHLNRPLYLLHIITDLGPKTVVITEGRNGAFASKGDKIYSVPSTRSKIADTTGAGDAFGAGFLAGYYLSKGDLQKSLEWGTINAGAILTEVGAQNGGIDRQELEARQRKLFRK
ncbi:MAG: hypothetical protein COT81_00975 [Candidatus Buchananbacteria bacterium CG10_big_fil_rev_8_21_14_0_10_42_9]|uniref:Carbohydrate kinase PfkB domain-containing protein n=1 Tax=Candidatus Buchananbacteria bacterium CG10_big_fil_rev_8_21_14_0_10_42_9 TaxID=1974526 RepID=A0A2H0W256_9BACT|nr:MAG: hypothetical protein COT81_00975 [Candidatus Buchananbacteria bacterium CG10_big_fil_rev_8_21_14_0_10_42_9]